jgi:two-component system chemotaxis sensor kinase CheA
MENLATKQVPDEVLSDFIIEANELIDQVNNNLLEIELGNCGEEQINRILRAFHTIKGTSSFLKIKESTKIAHTIEDLINELRRLKIRPSSEVIDVLYNTVDWYRKLIVALENQNAYDKNIKNLLNDIQNSLCAVENNSADNIPVPSDREDLESSFKLSKITENTIRINVENLDTLISLASELVLEKNRLLSVIRSLNKKKNCNDEISKLENLYITLGYIGSEVQEILTQTRMVPISQIFRKFYRFVRDLSREKHKSIDLVFGKEDPRIDRSFCEIINDLLVHLLRNAVDHGIETPEIRRTKGKPERGTIHLSAYQNGNHITIEVQDDGMGISPAIILQNAIQKEIISATKADQMTDKEILNLIFKPDFTTLTVASQISGRGIGLDVVKTNISKLNGTIDLDTKVDCGTKFTISFPVTLKILAGLAIKVVDEYFIIPAYAYYDILKLSECVIQESSGQKKLRYKNSQIPLISLAELLNISDGESQKEKYVIVVAMAEKRIGLIVTELFIHEETVVKSTVATKSKVPYTSGTTIRSNGQMALILDINKIIEWGYQEEVAVI